MICSGRLPESDELLLKEETVRLKRCIFAAQRKTLPPITTHNVCEDARDPVLNALRRCKLFNDPHDRVKVRSIDLTTFYKFSKKYFYGVSIFMDSNITGWHINVRYICCNRILVYADYLCTNFVVHVLKNVNFNIAVKT